MRRWIDRLQFVLGAVLGGAVTGVASGGLGRAMALDSPALAVVVGCATVGLTAWWHATDRGAFLREGVQIHRGLARRPLVGPIAYGFVLGIGWLTIVSTPGAVLWPVVAFTLGRPAVGLAYGVGFGLGRGGALVAHSVGLRLGLRGTIGSEAWWTS